MIKLKKNYSQFQFIRQAGDAYRAVDSQVLVDNVDFHADTTDSVSELLQISCKNIIINFYFLRSMWETDGDDFDNLKLFFDYSAIYLGFLSNFYGWFSLFLVIISYFIDYFYNVIFYSNFSNYDFLLLFVQSLLITF